MEGIFSFLPVIFLVIAVFSVLDGKKSQKRRRPPARPMPQDPQVPRTPQTPQQTRQSPWVFEYREKDYPYAQGTPQPQRTEQPRELRLPAEPLLEPRESEEGQSGQEGSWGDEGREYAYRTTLAAESAPAGSQSAQRSVQLAAPAEATLLAGFDKDSLAYGLVMAEILGPPRALKGRRQYGMMS
ncbi:MAG: hypothetical protein LBT32_01655 [Peptococcaceae bacterium]|jgi:hypothetical protein|nr:hypothetical protein [Peptococcaceae bacterium]